MASDPAMMKTGNSVHLLDPPGKAALGWRAQKAGRVERILKVLYSQIERQPSISCWGSEELSCSPTSEELMSTAGSDNHKPLAALSTK